ncbi:hypothetical protein DPEC_G00243290, partial [Dallia pectoralis]
LQDGVVLMKLVYRLRNEEPPKSCLDLPLQERLKVVSDFLQGRNRCRTGQGTIISWDNINNGVNLEVELSKVVVLLLYHSEINSHVDLNRLEFKFEVELASMLRFVLENEGSLYLSENLEKYLRKKPLLSFTSDVSSSPTTSTTSSSVNMFSDSESPVIRRKKGSRSVQFLDLTTVASSSVSSPLQEVINTPQFQLKKLQNQLRQERDLRDELEKDLASTSTDLEQRESQICQLQFRIEKLLREKAEQEQEPRDELQELLDKNECFRSCVFTPSLPTPQCEQLREYECTIARLEGEKEQSAALMQSLAQENQHNMEELREQLRLAMEQFQDVQEKNKAITTHLWEKEDALSQKEMTINGLEKQLQAMTSLASQRHQETLALQEELSLLKKEVNLLQEEVERRRAAEALAAEGAREKDRKVVELEMSVSDLRQQLGSVVQCVDAKSQDCERLETEVERREAQLQELSRQESSMREEATLLRREVSTNVRNLEEAQKEKEALKVELATQQNELREEVSRHQNRAAELQQSKEEQEAVIRMLNQQEEIAREEAALKLEAIQAQMQEVSSLAAAKDLQLHILREEATQLRQEISSYVSHLEQVQKENVELKEQKERAGEEANLKMEALQAQIKEVSSLTAGKDLQLCSLREEATGLQGKLAKQEQDIYHHKELLQEAHREKASVEALREELIRQQEELRRELISQQEKAAVLQKSLKAEQEALGELTVKEASAREEATQLCRDRLTHVIHLQQVQQENEELKEQAQRTRVEANLKVEALQAQMKEVSSLAAAKEVQLSSLREEATGLQGKLAEQKQDIFHHKELLQEAHREKESVEVLREELIKQQEELSGEFTIQQQKVANLQNSLKEEQEALRALTVNEGEGSIEGLLSEEHTALNEQLAKQQVELRGEVSLHQQKAIELQQSVEEKEEALRVLKEQLVKQQGDCSHRRSHLEQVQKENVELKEQKERAGEEANLKMEALQAQIKEVSSLTAGKDLQLCSLREEATGLQGKLAKQEQDIYHHKELLQEAHREKASVEALREELIRQQEELRRELISQQEKAAVLQKSLKAEQEALGELTVKEASAREEATQLCREIASHVIHLQQVQQENEELKEQAQRTRVEANLKVEALQAQMKEVSSLAAAKEVQLSSLREEATGLQGKLAEQKQDIFHHKELLQEAHREKESVEVLREELIKQQEELSGEFTIQQQKVANLQNSLKEEQEALRALTVNEVRAKEEVTRLCLEISTHVSHLDEMQKEKEALQDQGERAREEAYLKIEVLQTQMENVSSLAAAKELQLSTLRDESVLLRQENTKQAADLEVLQREKVQLEGLLSEEHTALNEQLAKQQVELRGEVSLHQQKAIELQQSVEEKEEALRVLKEQLVKQQGDCSLKKEVLQVSQAAVVQEKEAGDALRLELSLHQQRATELQKSLDEKEDALKEQEERARGEATRLSQEISTHVGNLQQVQQQKEELQMQKESARVEATLKMEALQARITEMSSLVAMKDQHLFNLREEANALQVKLAEQEQDISHHKELVQEAHREKESVRTLQKELTRQQEELREELIIQQEKAAELKQNMEDEQEALRKLTVKEASARVEATQLCQEISTHVSNLEQVRKEQEGLKEQKERAREEASLKIEALQAQMTEMSSLVAAKDQQLCNLREESILVRQENTKHAAHLEVLQREKVQLEGLLSEEHTALNEQLAKQQVELRGEVSFHQQKATELQQSVEEKEEALRVLKEQLVKQQGDCSLQKEVLQVAQAAVVQEKEAGDALRLELSLHQQRATELQNSLDEKEDALKEQEERAREEAIRFSQEISTHVGNLQQVQQQKEELQMQKESARAEATLKMEALQAQITEMSSLVAMKDQQLCTLGEEANALQGKLAEQEQDISHHKELLKESHREEESVETLQKELAKQQEELRREVSLHQLKTTELQQSVEEKEAALKELRKQENMQIEAVRLHQEISTRLEQVQKEGELKEREGRTREEVLHAQVEQMSSLAATKDLQLCSLKEEAILLRQEISMHVSHLEEVKTLKMESEGLLRKENTVLLEQLVKQKVEKGVLLEAESVAALGREKLDRQKEELMEELSVLQQEKNALVSQVLQAKQIQNELEGSVAELQAQRESSQREQRTQLDALILEKQRLLENNKVLERECGAKRLEAVLQEEQALMQEGMDGAKELERRNNELQEQLKAKTEAVEHYKAQMEKARSHYVGKKQQLVKVQEELTELQRVVEVKEHAVSAVNAEMKLLQKELDKARSTENALSTKVNTLKAQLAFAERHLRDNVSLRPENASGRTEKVQSQARQEISGDSLDLSLNDSLNTTTRPSQPEESSTPLVRSSGRLAAKRKSTEREGSLETLYFTPMNTRQINRTSTERRLESSITSLGELALDSAQRRPPTSSVKRRRTTQVINITMSKARGDDANETFYEMSSVRSNPDILGTHNTRPSSMEVSQTPGKGIPTSSDQLLNLPGYRRSTIHAAPPRSTSQFCVGTENEPEQAGDDWMRIAELQSRNQACLPHLKSSYPLESRPSLGPSFSITDDDLRTGDPSETIRRASMMPDQIQESLQSHRMSLHLGQVDSTGFSGPAYGSHRLSLMPQKASSNLSHQNTHALRASTLKRSAKDQRPNTPERGVTSCFPRPLTPKGGRFGSSNTQNRQIQSPAERRQSMAFSIDNTPQKAAAKSGFILRGMNKIRNSARKSPGHVSQTRVPRSGAAKSPRSTTGSVKSPGQGGKAQRRSPRTNNSKSPKVPTSTRKEPGPMVGNEQSRPNR